MYFNIFRSRRIFLCCLNPYSLHFILSFQMNLNIFKSYLLLYCMLFCCVLCYKLEFFLLQPRRGCFEIREEGGKTFISLLVIFFYQLKLLLILKWNLSKYWWLVQLIVYLSLIRIVHSWSTGSCFVLIHGPLFSPESDVILFAAGYEATFCTNEGLEHGCCHIWHNRAGQMI